MANDIFSAIGKAFNKSCNEVGASFQRLHDNAVKDIESIGTKTEQGGLMSGFLEAADVFSVGNVAGETLAAFRVIPDDGPLKEGISSGLNLLNGNFIVGLKDAAEALGAAQAQPNGTAQAPREAFTPEAPRAGERAGQGIIVTTKRPTDGYAGPTFADQLGGNMDKVLERIRDMFGKDKAGASDDELERAIDKILNSGMCFEDMIFALLKTIIRDTEKQGKAMFKELKGSRQESAKTRDGMTADIKAKREELKGETDPNKRAALQGELDDLVSERATFMDDTASSRAEIAEDLKNLMQKLSEMQQALSNILNAQHESAMAAIRNIR